MAIWQRKRMIFNGFLTLQQVSKPLMKLFMKQSIRPSWAEKLIRKQKKYLETEAIYPEKKNFVFSTHSQLQLPDAEVVNEDPVAFLKNLQMTEGKDIWVVGGGRLIKPLLENQMIDEWYIQIAPVLLGDGIPLFQKGTYEARFELLDTTRFGEFIELHYVRK